MNRWKSLQLLLIFSEIKRGLATISPRDLISRVLYTMATRRRYRRLRVWWFMVVKGIRFDWTFAEVNVECVYSTHYLHYFSHYCRVMKNHWKFFKSRKFEKHFRTFTYRKFSFYSKIWRFEDPSTKNWKINITRYESSINQYKYWWWITTKIPRELPKSFIWW